MRALYACFFSVLLEAPAEHRAQVLALHLQTRSGQTVENRGECVKNANGFKNTALGGAVEETSSVEGSSLCLGTLKAVGKNAGCCSSEPVRGWQKSSASRAGEGFG